MSDARRKWFAPLLAATILAIAGCASSAHRDDYAIIVVATPPITSARYYAELYPAHVKEIDGSWVAETARYPGKQILQVESGVRELKMTATLSLAGAYQRPAAERSVAERTSPPSRVVSMEVEAGKRYYVAARWPAETMPDAWEPAVWWVEEI
ncbi:MAG: hypothetical protein PVJ74_04470 [Gammaproteobacteria bacterium]|jgi:hypothetical protein